MAIQIQDQNFLVWEAYASGGPHGFSDSPWVIFHCLTRRDIRPRRAQLGEHEGEAQQLLAGMSPAELLAMLQQSQEIP